MLVTGTVDRMYSDYSEYSIFVLITLTKIYQTNQARNFALTVPV